MNNSYLTFWHGKRVLVTGHTGFKGTYLALWLQNLGAEVFGLSLEPTTSPNLFDDVRLERFCSHNVVDIRDEQKVFNSVKGFDPEIVLHLAAQPLVRDSFSKPVETISTNVGGTAIILNALRYCESFKAAVIVTTDKVYKNNEWVWGYRENDQLGGYDPYSASKAASEIITDSYYQSFFKDKGIGIASARAGNVIGGGDWSKDRIIPDAIKAWKLKKKVEIRNPKSVRPWQHVLDTNFSYLILAQSLYLDSNLSGAYNFGPETSEDFTVIELIELAAATFGGGEFIINSYESELHETNSLKLDPSKSKNILGTKNLFSTRDAIFETVSWYKNYLDGANALELCSNSFKKFIKLL